MNETLLHRLGELQVEEGSSHSSLTVFPLTGPRDGEVSYSLLEEALQRASLLIRQHEHPSVNSLVAINQGTRPVLILDGEELVGGKQNRMVNSSVLLPMGKTVLPVSCVEQGRWHDNAPNFKSPEAVYPSLRGEKAAQVAGALRSSGRHATDQGRVWENIRERRTAQGVRSDTEAMADLYLGSRDTLEAYERALPYPDGAVGIAVAMWGRMVSADVFDSPETMRKLWSKLVRASAVDALSAAEGKPVGRERAQRLLGRVKHAQAESFASPGLGQDVRVRGGGVVGSALIHEGAVIHAALFRTRDRTPGRIASQSLRRSLRET